MIVKYPLLKNKLILLSTGLICSLVFTKAQNVWSYTYSQNRPIMYFSSIAKCDSGFVIVGGTRDTNGTNYTRILLANIDSDGVMGNITTLGDAQTKNYGAFYNSLIVTVKGLFYYTGYTVDTAAKLLVLKKHIDSDTITLYEYYTPNSYAFQGCKMVETAFGFYVCGVRTDATVNSADNVLLKIDSNGNRLWQKQFGANNRIEYVRSLVLLPNGNLMMGSFRSDFNQTNEKANTWLLEVDTGGNIVRQWFDPNDSTYVAEGLRQTQDGGFIYGAQKKNYQSGFSSVSYIATIVKLDSNFNKQWTFNASSHRSIYDGITDIEELPDGNFIAAGHLSYYGTDTALNGYIVKLDADGNVIWERTYRGISTTQSLNFLSDIDILPDGGLIAVGQCQLSGATPPQVGWFLKLDSNGCEVENCLVGIETPKSPKGDFDSQMQIQPNPASDRVWVEVEPGLLGGELKLYDIFLSIL